MSEPRKVPASDAVAPLRLRNRPRSGRAVCGRAEAAVGAGADLQSGLASQAVDPDGAGADLGGVWARLNNDLLFPTFTATVRAFFDAILSGVLPARAWASIKVLLMGYACGVVLAALLTALAIMSRIGTDFLETMTSMFNPLAGHRPAAVVAGLVRARQWQPDFRAGAFGDLGDCAEHAFGLPVRQQHAEDGGAKLRPHRAALYLENPDPGGVSQHPDRSEDRLGFCVAYADRSRTCVRRQFRPGRAWGGSSSRTRIHWIFRMCSRAC